MLRLAICGIATCGIAIFGVAICGCSALRDPAELPALVLSSTGTQPVQVTGWRVFGPFPLATAADAKASPEALHKAVYQDDLAPFGPASGSFTEADAASLTTRLRWRNLWRVFRRKTPGPSSALVASDEVFTDLNAVFGKSYAASAYAASVLLSPTAQAVAMMGGSADGMRCWLNGQVVLSSPLETGRTMHPYSSLTVAHLRAGRNLLLCKVVEVYLGLEAGWGFRVAVSSLELARKGLDEVPFPLLDRYLVSPGGSLSPQLDLFASPVPATFSLVDREGRLAYRAAYRTNTGWAATLPPELARGSYWCEVSAGDVHLRAPVYVGTPGDIVALADSSQAWGKGMRDDTVGIDLAGWRYRVAHLLEAEHAQPADTNWQRKMVYAASELSAAQSDLRLGRRSFLEATGYHIFAYRSRVDSAAQYYGIHVPAGPRQPYPIAVSLLPALQTNRPFLDGVRVSDADRLEKLDELSNKYKVIVLEPQGRGAASGWPIQETDIEEALAAAEKQYPVDRDRVYLLGYCEAGREALLLAEHFPTDIVAVAAYGPSRLPEGLDAHDPAAWYAEHDIESLWPNLHNVPVRLVQGAQDTHVPLADTEALMKSCQAAGNACSMQVLPGITHSSSAFEDIADPILADVLKYRRTASPIGIAIRQWETRYAANAWIAVKAGTPHPGPIDVQAQVDLRRSEVDLETKNVQLLDLDTTAMPSLRSPLRIFLDGKLAWEGEEHAHPVIRLQLSSPRPPTSPPPTETIADAWSRQTLLVVGTGGSAAAQALARSMAEAIEKAYLAAFFVPLPLARDLDPRARLLDSGNLVLVGEAAPGSPLRAEWARHLRVDEASIALDGKRIAGRDLTAIALEPREDRTGSSLVLIDSNSIDSNSIDKSGEGVTAAAALRPWTLRGFYTQRVEEGRTGQPLWLQTIWQTGSVQPATVTPPASRPAIDTQKPRFIVCPPNCKSPIG